MTAYEDMSVEELKAHMDMIDNHIKKRQKHVGTWFEAYWHVTHKKWAVRLRPYIGSLWIGIYDSQEMAFDIVDMLDDAINKAKDGIVGLLD